MTVADLSDRGSRGKAERWTRAKVHCGFEEASRDILCRLWGAPIAGITVEELDDWLRNLECSPKTRANFRANIGVLFCYAERRRMIDSNPILRTAQPKLIDKAPEIFSVDELAALLNAALSNAPDVVPMLAIGAFAGLREAEIKRLDWAEIDLRRGTLK